MKTSLCCCYALIFMGLVFSSCQTSAYRGGKPLPLTAEELKQVLAVPAEPIISPVTYDNGVYYFPCTQASFGTSLSSFISQHKDLRLVSMTSDDSSGYGEVAGYFVVFEKRE